MSGRPETQADLLKMLRSLTSDRALASIGTARERQKRLESIEKTLDHISSERVISYIERHPEELIAGSSHEPSNVSEAKASVKKGTAIVSQLRARARQAQEEAEKARLLQQDSAPDLFIEASHLLGKLKEAEKRLALRKNQLAAFERKSN